MKLKLDKYLKEVVIFDRINFAAYIHRRGNLEITIDNPTSIRETFNEIYKSNIWESEESGSGRGSELDNTKLTRLSLEEIFEDYQINSILDLPCGDYNWMKEVDKGEIKYIGGDVSDEVINRNIKNHPGIDFRVIDITNDGLPEVDLILCKDVFQHLSDEDTKKAILNVFNSNIKYMLVTSYRLTYLNHNIQTGGYRPLNLRLHPYYFPKALDRFDELPSYENEVDKSLYLYDIEILKDNLDENSILLKS